jgi:S1-C subfamily serine protease
MKKCATASVLIAVICLFAVFWLLLASPVVSHADDVPMMMFQETRGLKIKSVPTNTIYQRVGLKRGDVVTKINDRFVRSTQDLELLEDAISKPGNYVVELLRDGKTVTLTYTVRTGTGSASK